MVKISVIIPVYNAEEYLEECLESVSCQTLEDIEIICVDDGSVDNSYKFMQAYQKTHDKVMIVAQKNAGSGSARNAGIDLAKGEYLMFVDPDDYLAECDVLEALYNAAKVNNVAVCGGNFVIFKTVMENGEYIDKPEEYMNVSAGMTTFKEYPYYLYHQRFIIKRKLLVDNKIFYPKYRRGQDMPFMVKVLRAAEDIYFIDKNIYMYRTGHKEEIFTEEKADDWVNAICDVLELTVNEEARELFLKHKEALLRFLKLHWYKILMKSNAWDRMSRVNAVISRGNDLFEVSQNKDELMNQDTYEKFYENVKWQCAKLEEDIKKERKFVIYGAGVYGKRIGKYLIDKGCIPTCFVVSKVDEDQKVLEGVSVISINDLQEPQEYLFVLGVADAEKKAEMKKCLQSKGCNKISDFDGTILKYL